MNSALASVLTQRKHSPFALGRAAVLIAIAITISITPSAPAKNFGRDQNPQTISPNGVIQNYPTTDEQLIELFMTPRLGAIALHDYEDTTELLEKISAEKNWDDLSKLFSNPAITAPDAENAMGVIKTLQALKLADDARRAQMNSGSPPSQEALDSYALTYLTALGDCFEQFDRAAKHGSKLAILNQLELVQAFQVIDQTTPQWQGALTQRQPSEDASQLVQVPSALRPIVLRIAHYMTHQNQIESEFGKLVAANYWPALELQLRRGYALQATYAELEQYSLQLANLADADAIAHIVAAGTMLRAAEEAKRQPERHILQLVERGEQNGLPGASWLAAEYHRLKGDRQKYLFAIERGAQRGNAMCLLRSGEISFLKQDHDKAFVALNQAFRQGCIDAASYLGWMHEQGLGTAANVDEARNYYELGHDYQIPECSERLGQLYLTGALQATVAELNYQIEGLPRLPEPNSRERQMGANLASAQVYLQRASQQYSARGDKSQAETIDLFIKKVRLFHEQLARASVSRAYGEWDLEKEDFLLDRRFDRMIEAREQHRLETEKRDARLSQQQRDNH